MKANLKNGVVEVTNLFLRAIKYNVYVWPDPSNRTLAGTSHLNGTMIQPQTVPSDWYFVSVQQILTLN